MRDLTDNVAIPVAKSVFAPRADKKPVERGITVGSVVPARELITIAGSPAQLPDAERLVHLQFRRFAGCPICTAHMHSIVQRYREIRAAGVRVIVLFHSSVEHLLAYLEQLPFAVVADPDKKLYREFGVESSPCALITPSAWMAEVRTMARKRRHIRADHSTGHLGLPADFLISCDGRVRAAKPGTHAYDQWSVD